MGDGDAGAGDSIESCFADLRTLDGISQISTRENVGAQIRLRLALETADRVSTSGTFPWAAVRLGLARSMGFSSASTRQRSSAFALGCGWKCWRRAATAPLDGVEIRPAPRYGPLDG